MTEQLLSDEQLLERATKLGLDANSPQYRSTVKWSEMYLLQAIAKTRDETQRQRLRQEAEDRLRRQVATVNSIALGVLRIVFLL